MARIKATSHSPSSSIFHNTNSEEPVTDKNLPLAQSQLDTFIHDGFLHLPGFIPESELIDPDNDSIALIERGLGDPDVDDRWLFQDDHETGRERCLYRVNGIFDEDMSDSFQVLMAFPPLLKAVSQLMN